MGTIANTEMMAASPTIIGIGAPSIAARSAALTFRSFPLSSEVGTVLMSFKVSPADYVTTSSSVCGPQIKSSHERVRGWGNVPSQE